MHDQGTEDPLCFHRWLLLAVSSTPRAIASLLLWALPHSGGLHPHDLITPSPKVLTLNTLSVGVRTSISELGVDIHIQTVATTKVKSDHWFGNMEDWSETWVEPVQGWMEGEVENNILNALKKFSLEGDLKRECFLVLYI